MAITPDGLKRSQPGALEPTREWFVLQLYTAGASPNSLQAITNIQDICAKHLSGRCQLQVVDIYQQPERAALDRIVAAPMLVKQLPPPFRRVPGSLSDSSQVLSAFGLTARSVAPVDDVANEA
jgi:circadian clock protein KaiB